MKRQTKYKINTKKRGEIIINNLMKVMRNSMQSKVTKIKHFQNSLHRNASFPVY